MHGVLMLPALAWLLSFTNWNERRRLRLVLVAACGYLVLAGVVASANLAGMNLLRLPHAVSALLALGALSLLVAGAVALVGVTRSPTAIGIRSR